MIYLDYSANTPADPAVLETFCRTEQAWIGNPNANHCAGQAARAEMAQVTDAIAAMLGVRPGEIIYTSGASESNNLAIKGVAQFYKEKNHVITTQIVCPCLPCDGLGAQVRLGQLPLVGTAWLQSHLPPRPAQRPH